MNDLNSEAIAQVNNVIGNYLTDISNNKPSPYKVDDVIGSAKFAQEIFKQLAPTDKVSTLENAQRIKELEELDQKLNQLYKHVPFFSTGRQELKKTQGQLNELLRKEYSMLSKQPITLTNPLSERQIPSKKEELVGLNQKVNELYKYNASFFSFLSGNKRELNRTQGNIQKLIQEIDKPTEQGISDGKPLKSTSTNLSISLGSYKTPENYLEALKSVYANYASNGNHKPDADFLKVTENLQDLSKSGALNSSLLENPIREWTKFYGLASTDLETLKSIPPDSQNATYAIDIDCGHLGVGTGAIADDQIWKKLSNEFSNWKMDAGVIKCNFNISLKIDQDPSRKFDFLVLERYPAGRAEDERVKARYNELRNRMPEGGLAVVARELGSTGNAAGYIVNEEYRDDHIKYIFNKKNEWLDTPGKTDFVQKLKTMALQKVISQEAKLKLEALKTS